MRALFSSTSSLGILHLVLVNLGNLVEASGEVQSGGKILHLLIVNLGTDQVEASGEVESGVGLC